MTHNKLVMLVEDNDDVRIIARTMIEHQGYKVEDYTHGLVAHEKLAELHALGKPKNYSMILSDIDMPHLDGLAFAERCAVLAPETPIVLMTGKQRKNYPKNVKEVLEKPIGMTELKRILETYAK